MQFVKSAIILFILSFCSFCLKFKESPVDPSSQSGFYLYFLNSLIQQSYPYLIGINHDNFFIFDLIKKEIYFKPLLQATNDVTGSAILQNTNEQLKLIFTYYQNSSNLYYIASYDVLNDIFSISNNSQEMVNTFLSPIRFDMQSNLLYFVVGTGGTPNDAVLKTLQVNPFNFTSTTLYLYLEDPPSCSSTCINLSVTSYTGLESGISQIYYYTGSYISSIDKTTYLTQHVNLGSNFTLIQSAHFFSKDQVNNIALLGGSNPGGFPAIAILQENLSLSSFQTLVSNNAYSPKDILIYNPFADELKGIIGDFSASPPIIKFFSYHIPNNTVSFSSFILNANIDGMTTNFEYNQAFLTYNTTNGCYLSIRKKDDFLTEESNILINTSISCQTTLFQYIEINVPIDVSGYQQSVPSGAL